MAAKSVYLLELTARLENFSDMPNRNKKSVVYNLDLSPELIEKLVAIARKRDLSMDEIVNEAVERYIKKENQEWQKQQRN